MVFVGRHTLEVMQKVRWYNGFLFNLIKPYCRGDILEVGSGIGNFSDQLSGLGNLTAIDYEGKYVDGLKKRSHNKMSVGFGDIEKGKYFFGSKKFDTIVCLNVLEHIEDDSKALKNMFTLLRSGGKLILLVPAHQLLFSDFDKNLGHFRRYNINNLSLKLTKIGFKITTIRYLNWLSAIGWLIFVKMLRRKMMPQREVLLFDKIGPFLISIEKYIKFPFGLSVFCVAEKI